MSLIVSKLDAVAQGVLARPLLLKSLQSVTLLTLGVLTGVATCLHTWVIPIIRQGRSTRVKTDQFRTAVTLGARYLQPSSRVLGLSLASLAFIFSRSSNPSIASRWKYYAMAMAILIPTAPYEIFMVFPHNYRLFDINDEIKQIGKDDFGDKRDKEVDGLLTKWRTWHTGRVLAPLAATAVIAWNAFDVLSL